MALPPEQIRLKRKATDEAPETLYLDADGPKRLRRSSDFCFQLLRPSKRPDYPLPSKISSLNDQQHPRAVNNVSAVPIVRATAPGAEFEDERQLQTQARLSREEHPVAKDVTELRRGATWRSDRPFPIARSRRFHLTRPSGHSPQDTRQLKGIGKKLRSRMDVALFAEKEPGSVVHNTINDVTQVAEATSNKIVESAQSTSRKKRPKATEIEKGLIETQKRILAGKEGRLLEKEAALESHEDQQNTPYGEPSERTQQILLDMAREHHILNDFSDLKEALDESMMDVDPQDGYVYETYIRVPRSELLNIGDPNEESRSIGFLVIEEEDQSLWEMYALADEDSEWDEEDEDSNAEDNPANEYPEEELDSEDEYGYGAYRHRHTASDNEEYDLENDGWSDEDKSYLYS